jgi:hypothetical protein
MATAKYLVMLPPGAQVPGIGFVREGTIFSAPSEDYVPSRTFRPLNQEAVDALAKVFEGLKAQTEKRLAAAEGKAAVARAQDDLAKLEALRARTLQLVEIPKEEPKVERGLSLAELDRIDAQDVPEKKTDAQAPPKDGGKRGDRKL